MYRSIQALRWVFFYFVLLLAEHQLLQFYVSAKLWIITQRKSTGEVKYVSTYQLVVEMLIAPAPNSVGTVLMQIL